MTDKAGNGNRVSTGLKAAVEYANGDTWKGTSQTFNAGNELLPFNPIVKAMDYCGKTFGKLPTYDVAEYIFYAGRKFERALAPSAEEFDANVNRLKACEHIACGDEGYEKLENECPSTKAVFDLRKVYEHLSGSHSAEPPKATRSAEEPAEDIRKIKLALGYCGVPTEEADWVYADAVAALTRLTHSSAEIRDRALDEAANAAENYVPTKFSDRIAKEIRALKSQPLAPQ